MLPSVGDKITAFFEGILACGTVHATEGQLISWAPVDAVRRRNVDVAEEGITWICGWHVEGSEEVNALRAAKKLRDSAERPHRDSSHWVTVGFATTVRIIPPTMHVAPNPAFDVDPAR